MKPLCFSIMPFSSSFDDISDIVRQAAESCGMDYVRGDLRNQPGSVLPQIVHDIRDAAVVIADLSGQNANVFYELGIAHQLKGPEQVVLITQSTDESPYDVHEFRQLQYAHSAEGRRQLSESLPEAIQAALRSDADRENWSVIRGRLQRTRLIVRDLERLIGADEKQTHTANEQYEPPDLTGVVIRCVSGLSSLAISDHEPPASKEGPEYDEALRAERDTLRQALLSGATFRVLLYPPRVFAKAMLSERLKTRYERLVGLFNGKSDSEDNEIAQQDLAAMRQCQWAFNIVPTPNQLIIGDKVAYEGFKRGGTRGFERTHCETNPESLARLIEDFDAHFADCAKMQPQDVGSQLESLYEEAMRLES